MTNGLSVQEQHLPTIKETLAHYALVQQVMKEVMKENTHYGASFPGDEKKNLLKPGADALCVAFHFVPEFDVVERDLGQGHREYRTNCTIKTMQNQMLVATGVGTCSTMETKFRYRYANLKCPGCGKETIIKGKEEYGGGWVCLAKRGGCGAKYKDDAPTIKNQERGKIENPDPADTWNTVLKMSKKRAFVDATITATAASDMFTQDIEEIMDAQERAEAKTPAADPTPAAKAEPKPPSQAGPSKVDENPEQQMAPAAAKGLDADVENKNTLARIAAAKTAAEVDEAFNDFRTKFPSGAGALGPIYQNLIQCKNTRKRELLKGAAA